MPSRTGCNALNDLQLTLKHAHWNVVGRDFIAVHEMLDPQIDEVREQVDDIAERMATMGVSPNGHTRRLVKGRSWDDYSLGRASARSTSAPSTSSTTGSSTDHRKAIELVGDIDPITEDMLIGQARDLEQFHWFIRAHLENAAGDLDTRGAKTEKGARQEGRRARPRPSKKARCNRTPTSVARGGSGSRRRCR